MHRLNLRKILNNLKSSAKKRNIPFELTIWDLTNLSFPITCPATNMVLDYHRKIVGPNSPSFDRIDSTKGYTIDNIIIVSFQANKMKNDGTIEQLQSISEFYNTLK